MPEDSHTWWSLIWYSIFIIELLNSVDLENNEFRKYAGFPYNSFKGTEAPVPYNLSAYFNILNYSLFNRFLTLTSIPALYQHTQLSDL